MGHYYEKWLQQERDWAKAIEDERKKKACLYAVITIACCVAILAGIGFMAGGAGPAVTNIKYGLILGVVGGGLYLVIMLNSGMAKKYMKRLEKEVESEIKSEIEREEFACEMLGEMKGKEPVSCMEFGKKGAVSERFCVCSDVALFRGMIPCLVRLDKTERIEVDVVESMNTIHAGDYKIRVNYNSYPIFFYYYKSQTETGGGRKQKLDKVMVFPSRELRDKAAKMMNRP